MKRSANIFYAVVAVFFVVMLYVNARYFRGSGNSSIGLAQSREYRITAEKAALVNVVHVVPGQLVRKGDALISLTSQELEIEIDKLASRIAILRSQQLEQSSLMASEIALIRAEYDITIGEIEGEVLQTRSESKLNRDLTNAFTTADTAVDETTPVAVKLRALLAQQRKNQQAMALRIQELREKTRTAENVNNNQIRLLERELELLQQEKKNLGKFANADGVVENVVVKEGEQVTAYATLMSVNPIHPTTVVAYLMGKTVAAFAIGKEVSVTPFDQRAPAVKGRVIGYGSVTALPEIMQKSTAVKAFGREVFIEVAPENEFANGEKVLIK